MLLAGRRLLAVGENDDVVRLLVAARPQHGAEVLACRGGREALVRIDAGGVDAVVVELPLHDLRGDVFLVALRDRGLPCVAVSEVLRGKRYAMSARKFGALAYLEKPFRAEAALGLIAQALPAASDPDTEPDYGVAVVVGPANAMSAGPLDPPRAQTPTPTPTPTPTASPTTDWFEDDLSEPDSVIYSRARPALDETLPGVPLQPPAAHGLELPLPSTTPPPVALRPDLPALPEGSLGQTAIPRLLVALHAGRATGALTVTRGTVKKLVLVEAGRPVVAASNVAAERFGARCVAEGVLTRDEHAALVAEIGPSASLADALVARGLLDEARRARMVMEQVRHIVWSTFAWRDGQYRFIAGPVPRRRVPIDLALGDLVLEGHRRVSAIEALRAVLPDRLALAPRADAAFQLYELALSSAEASLLAHVDGTKTVRDLVLLSHLAERDALAFLQGCRDLGLLDEVSRVLARTHRIGFM